MSDRSTVSYQAPGPVGPDPELRINRHSCWTLHSAVSLSEALSGLLLCDKPASDSQGSADTPAQITEQHILQPHLAQFVQFDVRFQFPEADL